MIKVLNIKDVKRGEFDEVWAIVRSFRRTNASDQWIKQVQALSPSWDLFKKYMALKDAGAWGVATFQNMYVPQFLLEMHAPEATNALNQLYKLDKAGKNIALVCFCPSEQTCHRSIVAGLLQGVGCNCVTALDKDYSMYYNAYKSI